MVRTPCVHAGDLGLMSDRGTKIPHVSLGVAQTNKNKTAPRKSTVKNKPTWSLGRTLQITHLSHPCWVAPVTPGLLVFHLRRTLLPRGLCTCFSLCESSSPRCPRGSFLPFTKPLCRCLPLGGTYPSCPHLSALSSLLFVI